MITFIKLEFLKLRDKKSFIIIFITFVVIAIILPLIYKDSESVSYSSKLGIIDLDESEKSIIFIDKLKNSRALNLRVFDKQFDTINLSNYKTKQIQNPVDKSNSDNLSASAEIKTLIAKTDLNALIIIPKNFFAEIPNSKIDFIYSSGDVISPALIDIITQAFVEDLVENIVYADNLSNYGKEKANQSVTEFASLKKEDFFNLELIKEPYNSLKGLKANLSINYINKIRSVFMYISVFNALFVALSLQIMNYQNNRVIRRMRSVNGLTISYYISSKTFSHFMLIIIPLLISVISGIIIKLKFMPLIFLVFASVVISILVYELITFFGYLIKSDSAAFTMNIISLIFLGIVGSAFFTLDMFPKAFIDICDKTPYYILSDSFYAVLDNSYITTNKLAICVFTNLCLIFTNYKLWLKQYEEGR